MKQKVVYTKLTPNVRIVLLCGKRNDKKKILKDIEKLDEIFLSLNINFPEDTVSP